MFNSSDIDLRRAEAFRRQAAFRLAGGGWCQVHASSADEHGLCMNCGIPVIRPAEPSYRYGGSQIGAQRTTVAAVFDRAAWMFAGSALTSVGFWLYFRFFT